MEEGSKAGRELAFKGLTSAGRLWSSRTVTRVYGRLSTPTTISIGWSYGAKTMAERQLKVRVHYESLWGILAGA